MGEQIDDVGEAALPTVADILALPALQFGSAELVSGAAGVTGRVRWLHVSELPDIAGLLAGGELILTTGIALPESDDELRSYVADLQQKRTPPCGPSS